MTKDKNFDKDIDLKKYKDPNGLNLEEMNFGLWLSENRQKLLKTLTIFLIILSVGLFIYSTYNYVIYFMSSGRESSSPLTSVTSPRQVTSSLVTKPLQVFPGSPNFDLAVQITNPNDKFMGSFEYCFKQSEQDLKCGQSYIMPGETKYILDLGQSLSNDQTALSFVTTNIFWQRINSHKIPDWNAYVINRLNFLVTNLNFSSAASSGLSNKVDLDSLSFTVKNQTAYGYYEAPFNILLFNGSDLVGVNRYLLENFVTGESRDVKVTWPGSLANVSQTEVIPDINIMDSSVYLPYSGTASN